MKNITIDIRTSPAVTTASLSVALESNGCWIESVKSHANGYVTRIRAPSDMRIVDVLRSLQPLGCWCYAVKTNKNGGFQ